MVETERNSDNLYAVTKTKSDAVFEALDSSRQTKVQRMLHKLKSTTVKGMTVIKGQRNSAAGPAPVRAAQEQNDDLMDETDPSHSPSQCNFENMMEQNQWKNLVIQIKQALSSVGDDEKFGYELLIPCGLVMRIARDIMASARKEPCGLRGCVLFINLEDKIKCQNLVKLDCDPTTVTTFELYLTLKEDTRGWCRLKKFFISMSGYLDKKKNSELKLLSPGYGLDKKKLYRLSNN